MRPPSVGSAGGGARGFLLPDNPRPSGKGQTPLPGGAPSGTYTLRAEFRQERRQGGLREQSCAFSQSQASRAINFGDSLGLQIGPTFGVVQVGVSERTAHHFHSEGSCPKGPGEPGVPTRLSSKTGRLKLLAHGDSRKERQRFNGQAVDTATWFRSLVANQSQIRLAKVVAYAQQRLAK